jgi:hypothetical protein
VQTEEDQGTVVAIARLAWTILTRTTQCDEVRPVCSTCSRKGSTCTYSRPPEDVFVEERFDSAPLHVSTDTNNQRRFQVDLTVARSQETQTGNGLYFIFKPSVSRNRQSSISPPLSLCQQEALVKHLIAVWGTTALEVAPFGEWMKADGGTLGGLETEHAAEYVRLSVSAFLTRSSETLAAASRAGHRAIGSLRKAVDSHDGAQDSVGLLNAAVLHYAAEVRIEEGCAAS